MNQAPSPQPRPTWSRRALALLGRPGRVALIGLVAYVIVAVSLGFFIPAAVERALLKSRLDTFAEIAGDVAAVGMIEPGSGAPLDPAEFDEAVRLELRGAAVLRVVLWNTSGVAVYSDDPQVLGVVGETEDLARALAGDALYSLPDHGERGLEDITGGKGVREYYIPVRDGSGEVAAVFEVYEDATPILATLDSTRLFVWLSLGLGLAALFVFVLALTRGSLAALDDRRRQAEILVAGMADAQESERKRIMGTLHDEIAQPLYRVLYGLEGSVAQLEPDDPVTAELSRTSDVVRWIDGALRSELIMLHQGSIAETDLDTLLRRLVEDVRSESKLAIELELGPHDSLTEGARAALFRAVREAVTNARKHAGAQNVTVKLTEGSHRILVDVEDDGRGFDGEIGLGLSTTRDRLTAIGGGLDVRRSRYGGTLFRAWVPLTGEEARV